MKKKVVASIQARMGSSRLPGKVLESLCGKPMIQWQIERLRASRLVDQVVVATSNLARDNEIVAFCEEIDVECFRGSEQDVLGRVSGLIREYSAEVHVECFGDSPLTDPQLIDEFVGYFFKYSEMFDAVTNSTKTSYPPGLDFWVYRGSCLVEVDRIVDQSDSFREHAGYNLTRFPKNFRIKSLEAPDRFAKSEYYLEVDTPADLEVVRDICSYFNANGPDFFGVAHLIEFMDSHQRVARKNAGVERRWKTLRNE